MTWEEYYPLVTKALQQTDLETITHFMMVEFHTRLEEHATLLASQIRLAYLMQIAPEKASTIIYNAIRSAYNDAHDELNPKQTH